MKALELTIYPKLERPVWGHQVEGYRKQVRAEIELQESKRLTDAELAAEYYAQDSKCRHEQWIETVRGDDDYTDAERAGQSQMYERLTALHRFATLPDYDEAAL